MGGKWSNYKKGDIVGECTFLYNTETKNKTRRAVFKCKCGNEFEAYITLVRTKRTRSCGCLHLETMIKLTTTHDMTNTRLYKNFRNMKTRCYNPNVKSFKDYGARGIKICDEWKSDFKAFYDYVTELPNYGKKGYTLDRENNDKDYEPGNVRWVDGHTQKMNGRKRKSKSGFTGVIKQYRKWRSTITVNQKTVNFGYFDNFQDAVNARNNYIIQNGLWEYDIQLAEAA